MILIEFLVKGEVDLKMKINKELRENYVASLKSNKSGGWFFIIFALIYVSFVWIFGSKDIWTLEGKILLTLFFIVLSIGMGLVRIKEANRKLKEIGIKLELENLLKIKALGKDLSKFNLSKRLQEKIKGVK